MSQRMAWYGMVLGPLIFMPVSWRVLGLTMGSMDQVCGGIWSVGEFIIYSLFYVCIYFILFCTAKMVTCLNRFLTFYP